MKIKYLYHTTSARNLIAILKEKRLYPKGERIDLSQRHLRG